MTKVASSYMRTNGAALTRAADVLSWTNVMGRPQALTVYLRFVDSGVVRQTAGATVLAIGVDPAISVREASGVWAAVHSNGTANVTGSASVATNTGDLVELVIQVSTTGTVTVIQSLNSATATTGSTSGALKFGTAWSVPTLSLGSNVSGANQALVAIRNVLVARGVQTLATMRRLAGT
jgi:Tfp pilus assembly protein PilW